MVNELKQFIAVAILLGGITLATTMVDDAEAVGSSAPTKLFCTSPANPSVYETQKRLGINADVSYDATVKVQQIIGSCSMMSGNTAHIYQMPYYAIKVEVVLFDLDFPEAEALETRTLTYIMDEEFSISFDDLSVGIPYGVKITSWHNDENNIKEIRSTTTTLFLEDPYWMWI